MSQFKPNLLTIQQLQTLADAISRANSESTEAYLERYQRYLNDPEAKDLSPEPEFPRSWHLREQQRQLHPVVVSACAITRPFDWHQLVLEWPHEALGDRTRLAYTRDDEHGRRDLQTVTSIGKYLVRHWKGMLADNVIRDLAAKHTAQGIEISDKMEDFIEAACQGPYSCMQWSTNCIDRRGGHPYQAYDPKYGWRICIQRKEGRIVGRALLLEHKGSKVFVRSFYNESDSESGSYSGTEMEAWLQDKGWEHRDSWPSGAPLAKVKGRESTWLLPYLDGGNTFVDDEGDYFSICSSGDYECQNQDGSYEEGGNECEDCGCHQRELNSVGYHGDREVCDSCLDNNYTLAYGRNGNQYYADDSHVVHVNGEAYDERYLGDNDIITLGDGEYAHEDDAVKCDQSDEWYLKEDCVYVSDRKVWVHEDEAWQCAGSDNWYIDDDPVEIEGEQYHPDHAPEDEDQLELGIEKESES